VFAVVPRQDSWPTVEQLGGKETVHASNEELMPGEEIQLQEAMESHRNWWYIRISSIVDHQL